MTSLPDWTEGTTHLVMQVPWTDVNGTAIDLTGATLSGILLDSSTDTSRVIAGTLAQDGSVTNQMNWTMDATDVVAGKYEVQFTATFSSKPARTFRATWYVEAKIS